MVPQEWNDAPDNDVADRDVRIRVAEEIDLDELHSLDVEVFGTLAYPFFTLRQLVDTHIDCWQVAEHPTGLVGYSLSVPTTDHSAGWLLGLAVRPRFRRRGYGLRLTLASLAMLRDINVHLVRLTVDPGNVASFDLYRKLGFTGRELVRDYLGPGEHRLLMSRTI